MSEKIVNLEERPAETGPVILQNSFRPFFMAAGLWAMLAIPFWLLTYAGLLDMADGFDGLLWHQHEMLFGFAAAAIAGFILTAIPNWTGGLPVKGKGLGLLVVLWIAGRIAMLSAPALGPLATAILDLSYLTALSLVIARELISGKNWRNLPVLVLISLFTLGNWLVHLGANDVVDTADLGLRLSTFVLAILVAVIGGRIVPSFTRNWLARSGAVTLPDPMNRFDTFALATLVIFVVAEVFAPDQQITAVLALVAGIMHGLRLIRWKGWAVLSEPLMWVMHLGYTWLAVALVLIGLSGLTDVVPYASAIHALTTGAFSTMILAVMTRASLGHSGRPLIATRGTTLVFVLITIAALTRVCAPFLHEPGSAVIWLSGGAWTAAFALFSVLYFPVFTQPKR